MGDCAVKHTALHFQITITRLRIYPIPATTSTCFSCLVDLVRYGTDRLMDGRDSDRDTTAILLQELPLSKLSAWTQLSSKNRARQTGPSYTMFLMSRCYGTRPHDKWHSPYQLLKNMPYFLIKTDGLSYRAPQWSPRASSLPGDRSVFSFFNCLDSYLFSQATTASPGFFFIFFFYLGIPNNFRAHAGIQTE